jgi:DNA-directed RNA polymerase subunit RPC12/RpoP
MNVTKKGKKIKVRYKKYEYERSEYICPTCKTKFIGDLDRSIIRFRCNCGQELIVN